MVPGGEPIPKPALAVGLRALARKLLELAEQVECLSIAVCDGAPQPVLDNYLRDLGSTCLPAVWAYSDLLKGEGDA